MKEASDLKYHFLKKLLYLLYGFTWTPVPGSRKEARKRAASRYFMFKTLKYKNYAFDN